MGKPDLDYHDSENIVVDIYKAKFVNSPTHLEFLATESPDGPLSISVLFEPNTENRALVQCSVIVRSPQVRI